MKGHLAKLVVIALVVAAVHPARAEAPDGPDYLFVSPNGDCDGWAPCYSSPQAALDAAAPGSIIRIATGTYVPATGAHQVLAVTKSISLQGGFRTTDWSDPQPVSFPTVLDAQGLGSAIVIAGSPGQPIAVSIHGLQITNGQAGHGGGITGTNTQLSLERCLVSGNHATGTGGGIYLTGSSSLTLLATRVTLNTSATQGGAIALDHPVGGSSLIRSWIYGNQAASGGGGVSLAGGQLSLDGALLVDNTLTQAGATGSGLEAFDATVALTHTTLARNTGGLGAGIHLSGVSTLTAANLLAAGQTAAFALIAPSHGTIDGVLWGGGATWANGANTTGSGGLTVQHAYTGDPLFVGLDSADLRTYFHIAETSPARDRSVTTPADYIDIDTQPFDGTIADLGADEYRARNTVIRVAVQAGGDVEQGTADATPENMRGALFWNGADWVSNDTAAHTYFTDSLGGNRLLQYALVADVNGNSPADQDVAGYHVTRSTYSYTVPYPGSGTYRVEAAQYLITKSDTQEVILLNSRSNGYGQASFDIYIQTPISGTLALRGGSAWFNYPDLPAVAAQRALDDPSGRAGLLTTCDVHAPDRSRYWLDMNGGSDMAGITYFLHTVDLPTRASVLGSCFADEFRVKFMQTDPSGLAEFRLRPAVYSETLLLPIFIPAVLRQGP